MAVTGELNDLSLAELIEFFCNQRKTGRLTVSYPNGAAYFYLQSGAVVHATIGNLNGTEAVFYALTLRNASFAFAPAVDAPQKTIDQPWISVVLEGLRRMDEGIKPEDAFPEVETAKSIPPDAEIKPVVVTAKLIEAKAQSSQPSPAKSPMPASIETKPQVESFVAVEAKPAAPAQSKNKIDEDVADRKVTVEKTVDELPMTARPVVEVPGFLAQTTKSSPASYTPWKVSMIFAAVAAVLAAVAVPWAWYARAKSAKSVLEQSMPSIEASTPVSSQPVVNNDSAAQSSATDSPSQTTENAELARQQREARIREEARIRAKAAENATPISSASPAPAIVRPTVSNQTESGGTKKVTVQVTYDENGRVTQASGGDATALRIARQKRFPPGKAGSATITVPIN